MRARTLPTVPGIDPLSLVVTPMSVRSDYKLSAHGHRFVGSVKGVEVIDTGWHPTASKASVAYGRELGRLAALEATRYLA